MSGCRRTPAFRTRASLIISPPISTRAPALWRSGPCSTTRSAYCCPACSCACGCRSSAIWKACWCQLGRYLLVVNDKNVVEQRQVQTGDAVDGGMRIIKAGLKAEDRVVVNGNQRAIPGGVVKPVDAVTAASTAAPVAPAARKD